MKTQNARLEIRLPATLLLGFQGLVGPREVSQAIRTYMAQRVAEASATGPSQ